jgi:hypothetical protein
MQQTAAKTVSPWIDRPIETIRSVKNGFSALVDADASEAMRTLGAAI